MSDDRLARIEQKLDGLVENIGDLRSTAAEMTVGQGTLEHGFARMERDWNKLERNMAETFTRIDVRLTRAEDAGRYFAARIENHEQRLAALENSPRST